MKDLSNEDEANEGKIMVETLKEQPKVVEKISYDDQAANYVSDKLEKFRVIAFMRRDA